jgi:hypothetical protein
MARKKKTKMEDVDRNFSKVEDTNALDQYYEENGARVETSPENIEGLFGVDNLFSGSFEAILIPGTPETASVMTKYMKKSQQGIKAFTLFYEGKGIFRYALPTEDEVGAGSFKFIPSDVTTVGRASSLSKQW